METTRNNNAMKHHYHPTKNNKKNSQPVILPDQNPSTNKTKEFFQSILNKINALPTGGSLSTQEVARINAQFKTLDTHSLNKEIKPVLIDIKNASNPNRVSLVTTPRLLEAAAKGLDKLS